MRAKILDPSFENISFVADVLHRSEVVGVPTETVYGLAGDCHSPLALARIFDSKERPTFDPLIVHVGIQAKGLESLEEAGVVDPSRVSDKQREWFSRLTNKFWPGPLTLVLPKHKYLPELVTSGLDTVAVRMPRHPVMLSLLARFGKPLAAPSANRFGHISPTRAQAVEQELGDRIGFILDGGESEIGLESTILNLSAQDEIQILRYGGIPIEEIAECLPEVRIAHPQKTTEEGGESSPKNAPGMLSKHYSPDTPFFLLPRPLDFSGSNLDLVQAFRGTQKLQAGRPIGMIRIQGDPKQAAERLHELLPDTPVVVRSLSEKGDLRESAHQLFSTLREMDALGLSALFSEPCNETKGLGYAIGDRLRRAAAP